MRSFGLIGYPLSHSFSEKYFSEKFTTEGIRDCRYQLFPIPSIKEFTSLVKSHPMLVGLNVTIPYKKQVISFLDEKHMPEGLEACNCIHVKEGKLLGYNTDWKAFTDSLQPLLKTHHKAALVLGSGGAAEAVIFALKKMGIKVSVVSRTAKPEANYTYADLDKKIINAHKIIVNTTPVGLYPNQGLAPEIPYEHLSPEHLLFDLVYNPAETIFLKKGKEKGATIKNGTEMLSLQAEESWKIWTGVEEKTQ